MPTNITDAARKCVDDIYYERRECDGVFDTTASAEVVARHMTALADAVRAEERERCAKAEPDMWWLAVDTEYSVHDPEEAIEDGDYADGAVIQMQAAKQLPDRFFTVVRADEESDQTLRPSTHAEIEAYIASRKIKMDKRIAEAAYARIRGGGE